jgi:hypothetical protein
MFGAVKMTLIICLTIVIVCVLLISYNEYEGRYFVIGSTDNSLYIFDKKSAVLNKCSEKGCVVVETKLPQKGSGALDAVFQTSRMFGSDKAMPDDVAMARANAVDGRTAQQAPNEMTLMPEGGPAQASAPVAPAPAVAAPAPAIAAPPAEPRPAQDQPGVPAAATQPGPASTPDDEFVE